MRPRNSRPPNTRDSFTPSVKRSVVSASCHYHLPYVSCAVASEPRLYHQVGRRQCHLTH